MNHWANFIGFLVMGFGLGFAAGNKFAIWSLKRAFRQIRPLPGEIKVVTICETCGFEHPRPIVELSLNGTSPVWKIDD